MRDFGLFDTHYMRFEFSSVNICVVKISNRYYYDVCVIVYITNSIPKKMSSRYRLQKIYVLLGLASLLCNWSQFIVLPPVLKSILTTASQFHSWTHCSSHNHRIYVVVVGVKVGI